MSQHTIPCTSILTMVQKEKIRAWIYQKPGIHHAVEYLSSEFNIQITSDPDVVKSFERDASNLPGNAEILCRPVNDEQCALILSYCRIAKIPLTIAAGRTNLNGSATPNGGIVMSIEKMTCPEPKLNLNARCISSPVGIYLEDMRKRKKKKPQFMI